MYPNIEKLKKILLKESYISEADSTAAEQTAADSAGYIAYLIEQQLLDKSLLGQALAEAYRLRFIDFATSAMLVDQPDVLSEEPARSYRLIVVSNDEVSVLLATDSPETIDPPEIIKLFPGKKVRLAYTLPEYIEQGFDLYIKPLATRFSQIISSGKRVAPEIIDEIIRDALSFKASDIHFEPHSDTVVVRFRVDGSLREAGILPKEYYDNILNRIKVESGMRIDEHLSAQDGAIQRESEGRAVDLRVSLIPTVEGEKVVMRVLGSYVAGLGFGDLNFSDHHREIIERCIAKPFGMILTVGPTGSGKTTTLYSLLKLLNKPDVNITTIEDPVEYKIAGTNQIQVREQGTMTFARGLRSIVRQDPDVILVGEIRDRETAEISVNAALTGHLLLSSFHSNDASTAMPRLCDMGVEPFLLASTLEIIIAQRLVRKLCATCRYSLSASEATTMLPDRNISWSSYFSPTDSVYASKGCNVCNGSGYQGRIAVYEIIEVSPAMQELMVKNPSNREIELLARSEGSQPMFADGIDKVKTGLTSVEELLRVVPVGIALTPPETARSIDEADRPHSAKPTNASKLADRAKPIKHDKPAKPSAQSVAVIIGHDTKSVKDSKSVADG